MTQTASLTNFSRAAILNHIWGGVTFPVLGTLYFAYFLSMPSASGPGAEPNPISGYARLAIANTTANFPITANQIKTSGVQLTFTEATENQGNVVAVGLFDSASSGNLLAYWVLTTPVMIQKGDQYVIPVGDLVVTFPATASGGGVTNFVKNGMLNHMFGGMPMNPAGVLYAGYTTSAPTDAGGGTEPSAGAYARSAVANNATFFPVTTGNTKLNGQEILFPEATGEQGTASYVALWDSITGGNMLSYHPINPTKAIDTPDVPRIAPAQIAIVLT